VTQDPSTSYDELPYESFPFAFSHPDRLATVALLHGLRSPAVDRCRVLELGCASGGNLIPMAVGLPNSQFVGIDLSRRQIGDGQQTVAALGLRNIELKALSILEVGADFGQFDYIICHGVYSWVPPEVQDRILAICADNLTAAGVAYVSYNTYPGWQIRHMVRDVLYYRARHFEDPRQRVRQARVLLEFLARSAVAQEGSVYHTLLKGAAEVFRQKSDTYLLHEYLEEVNEPVYFHQFAERAAAKGLHYLADAKLPGVLGSPLAPEVEQALRQLAANPLEREQYVDFLGNQAFRRSLLCHPQAAPKAPTALEAVNELYAAAPTVPLSTRPNLTMPEAESFRGAGGVTLTLDHPLLKAAFMHLGESWPRAVALDALQQAARARLGRRPEPEPTAQAEDTRALTVGLLRAYLANVVELHAVPPPCGPVTDDRPTASPLVRYQARQPGPATNLRHELVELNDVERCLVMHLDGRHDRDALVEALVEPVLQGKLVLAPEARPLRDADKVRQMVRSALEEHLERLARRSVLMG
jgi:methyltransferase-like protein